MSAPTPPLRLSVVFAARRSLSNIQRTLESLLSQTAAPRIEFILSADSPELLREAEDFLAPRARFAQSRFLLHQTQDLSRARALSVAETTGDVVAFNEDHCFPEPNWAEELLAAFASSGNIQAAAPAMLNPNPETAVSRVQFLSFFGLHRKDSSARPRFENARSLPAHNTAYRRDALAEALREDSFLAEGYVQEKICTNRPQARLVRCTHTSLGHVNMSRLCPAISVVMLVGTNRANAQGVLDALGRQSCADDLLEIVVFDCADESVPALQIPGRFSGKYLRRPGLYFWRVARALAAQESTAPIVAFLEDHCEPHATWAERLLEAYSDGRWAAVGYAFTNGSRDSWWSRSALMADYGFFAQPVEGGPARLLAGNNVSYARWFLDELGEDFEKTVGVDFNVQEMANARGLPMKVAPNVLAAHRCYPNAWELCAANFYYLKILSVARAKANGWRFPTRFLWACGVLVFIPALRVLRLAKSISRRPTLLPTFVAAVPVVFLVYYAAACGEAAGYLFGLRDAEEKFVQWELNTPRIV